MVATVYAHFCCDYEIARKDVFHKLFDMTMVFHWISFCSSIVLFICTFYAEFAWDPATFAGRTVDLGTVFRLRALVLLGFAGVAPGDNNP